jgi:hypothetical protein
MTRKLFFYGLFPFAALVVAAVTLVVAPLLIPFAFAESGWDPERALPKWLAVLATFTGYEQWRERRSKRHLRRAA